MKTLSLVLASVLLLAPIIISYKENLNLEKDIIVSVLRAIIQLFIIGYILEYIFKVQNKLLIIIMVTIIVTNASCNTVKKSENINKSFFISFIAIGISTFIIMSVLILSKAINFVPNEVITVSGMVVSNSMIGINLCYRSINSEFKNKKKIVEAKLSLGSSIKHASKDIINECIKTAMIPTLDSAKTLGIVSLPGTMTGLILAGQSPLLAIKFQIMVTFMIVSATAISAIIVSNLAYKSFFNDRYQLK
ncbi:iron export ABC transporter permease subunit FetB [Romboutsia maritimum]|uniref:Iron export ABC transporter permease subunit FetB n=1 Tax=Romboutsia maritimum TaxID=2020948 RepID=A0A371ITF6_9FIRM|nr:iron export ABC transporter permease subunit FetB [Romboutsia maritimum]RDY23739.1 iron export ABC transporter permease subunit FetB [Romboutsia maritimum]